jgi:DNA-binding response OmpR family regulator
MTTDLVVGGAPWVGRYDRPMTTVLVVDDEPMVRDVVARYLAREGFGILEAADGAEARAIIERTALDLVVLDVMLPEINGLDLCRWIRETSSLPVIVLTARSAESDRIVGLELGADDYVVKPFSPRELVARVRSALRRAALPAVGDGSDPGGPSLRAAASEPPPARAGSGTRSVALDPVTRRVEASGRPVELTAKEFDLLHWLVDHPGQVFSRGQLLGQVWGYDGSVDVGTATVTVHVRRLREKIEPDPAHPVHIQTVWGVGYRFEP